MILRLSGPALFLLISISTFAASPPSACSSEQVQPSIPTEMQEDQAAQEKDPAKLELEVVKLYQEGKFEEAIPLAKQVVKIREQQLAANDPLLADSLGNLAMLYLARKKFDDAESLLLRALTIYEQTPGSNPLVLSKTLDSLGHVRLFKTDIREAEKYYLRALAAKEQAFSPDHGEVLYSLNNLVEFHVNNNDYGAANAMLQRIISIKEQKLGASDTQVGRLLERMACLMYKNKQNAEAEKVEARANHILYSALAAMPDPIELPHQVFACKLINNPRPDFVSIARNQRLTGMMKVDVAIETDEAGNVTAARLIGGHSGFKSVAEKAARGAKLRPTIVDGRGVKVGGVISHQFRTTTRTVVVAVPGRLVRP
ncbi:MAG TPA: tetratricopeptide repeat protein [Pyrinomonadaceae bacterium]|nr:tetratricopeptide repeat protein [Pyrinomonadaceae bacterium]